MSQAEYVNPLTGTKYRVHHRDGAKVYFTMILKNFMLFGPDSTVEESMTIEAWESFLPSLLRSPRHGLPQSPPVRSP